jgi:DNA polymerase III delta prime subunit
MTRVNGYAGAGADTPALGAMDGHTLQQPQHSNPVRFTFAPAVKRNAKLRLALTGPGGSGKTYTALALATALGGPIAVVDTEHGSASKYANLFRFDVTEVGNYDPGYVPDLIQEVAAAGYSTLVVDSWSHFWMGKDGELEQVDQHTTRSRSSNSFAAWRHVSPKHNAMVDAMLSAPIHIIVTMRVKTEWVVEQNEKGRTVPRKIGLAPVMKDGVEYEFDVCGDLDQDNNLMVSKSRCPELNGKLIARPGAEMGRTLRSWLGMDGVIATPPAPSFVPTPQSVPAGEPFPDQPTRGTVRRLFLAIRERVGERAYLDVLARFGVKSWEEIRSIEQARDAYNQLTVLAGVKAVA